MSSNLLYLGEFVFPICEFAPADAPNELSIVRFHGTGFMIGTDGYFLSARHVINEECLSRLSDQHVLAAIIKTTDNNERVWKPARITNVEDHSSIDVVLGKIDHRPPPFFSSRRQVAYGWEDVHTFGYPDTRTRNPRNGLFEFNPQFLKGYISRRVEATDPMVAPYGPSYELSFPIPLGVSGSPVFRLGEDHSLIGIAVASLESSVSVHEYTSVEDDGKKFSEVIRKVEQFGVAIRLADVANWAPRIAGGKCLGELY